MRKQRAGNQSESSDADPDVTITPTQRTKEKGVLAREIAKTGEEPVGPFRLGGIRNVYASPAAADRVYITDQDSTTLVISHEDTPRVLAVNRLDDSFSASAALVGHELFLRGQGSLYCIAEK